MVFYRRDFVQSGKRWPQVRNAGYSWLPFAAGTLAAAFVFSPAHATEGAQSVESRIASLRGQVTKAVLIAGPRPESYMPRRRMNEADLPRIGCIYKLDAPVDIAALMDLISTARFAEDPTPKGASDLRFGVYLQTPNGEQATLLLGRTYHYAENDVLSGGDVRATFNGLPTVAKAPIEQELRSFVRRFTPSKTTIPCDLDRK